ncbi:hypothetical protein RclHR1_06540016 [Rhizophagus clarus]|uniref:CENP-B homolog protein 2-like n=1 Tax=Rhizophagus clarus TaxID=94130 RepID=A0A2Z6RSQ3_9GLOM|nr:hypothetical protein RclHR1_06540016 [Rhizophagus clarus]GES96945.1 CENP-B homolog protein 2-like [Rhizophagus clarus]
MGKVNRKHFNNNNSQKKKRKTLTFNQKKELCEKHRDQNLSGVQLAKEYEISDSAVSDILKKSEHWLSINSTLPSADRFREKTCNYPQIEEVLSIWVDQQISRDLTLSGPIIQEKQRKAGSAPISEIPQMKAELQEIFQEYELRDIWNCDETALFWHLLPCKTIAHSPVVGKKHPKERVSILAACNASGDEKLPLLFIHKYETPRVLKGIEKISLPVWYYWNSKAWMQRSIFKHFLERLNRERRHIILLMDNAKCHDCDNISIKIHFLPPNTTSHLQPLDQGIIYSLKAQYHKLLCKNRIRAYDLYDDYDQIPPPVDILDSINLIAEAWKIVTKKTIINSCAKVGILSDDEPNTSDSNDSEVEDDIENLQLLINELPITIL